MNKLTKVKIMKKALVIYGLLAVLVLCAAGVAFAAFTDQSKIQGSTFSVGSADIRLLADLGGGVVESNLVDEKPGPTFSGIHPFWVGDYLVKVYNNGSAPVTLTSNAYYETVNDPDDLRSIIYVQPFAWNDLNADGVLDDGELGVSLGVKDTIIKYKTVGYNFGNLNGGEVKNLVLRFSTDTISDSKQGANALFDFEFDSVGVE